MNPIKLIIAKVIIGLFVITCFITCKKYPENKLWFKRPFKIPVIQGNIVAYTVNGIDSLGLLNNFYTTYTVGISPPNAPYTNDVKNINIEKFSSKLKGLTGGIKSDLGIGSYAWDGKKKNITIFFTADYNYFKKNIFISREALDWEVQYLDKKGKSKIKTTFNGNVYEITFQD